MVQVHRDDDAGRPGYSSVRVFGLGLGLGLRLGLRLGLGFGARVRAGPLPTPNRTPNPTRYQSEHGASSPWPYEGSEAQYDTLIAAA